MPSLFALPNGEKIIYMSAAEYIAGSPELGCEFKAPPFRQSFYRVRDCLCTGNLGQNILPIKGLGKRMTIVLNESFSGEYDLATKSKTFCQLFGKEVKNIPVAVPLFPFFNMNFWHAIFECLPRVLALEAWGYNGPYIISHDRGATIRTLLDFCGIAPERVLTNEVDYIVAEIILAPVCAGRDLLAEPEVAGFIREAILGRVPRLSGRKRLYVRRLGFRRVLNEDEILDILKPHGFEVMVPEEEGFAGQFSKLTNVEFSIMPHGANAALIAAQPENSVFLELFSNSYTNYVSTAIIKHLNLLYVPLVEDHYNPYAIEDGKAAQEKDIMVDVRLFRVLVENYLSHLERQKT